ncbi:RNA polymerase sigma factor [Gilvibacter sediminis]|uniref:RNA polymerase sigma factor n=1 Tax=Gilvibacter sediminis TaxID=379071 RepID=UPI00235035DB|nr:RNA polymerase sigma factor [Gilvibacter sediminis]MDC7998631.1 RNA polymerase sigma factor [Gilvibacter sediminis]
MSSSLTELIAACKKGDPRAQEQLFLELRDAIYTTSLKYCRNVEEAQDNVHDAFVIVFETIKKYKGKGSFAGWMQRIAINQAVKKYRNKRKEHLTEDPSWFAVQEEDDNWAQSCDLDQLLDAIQQLPDQYRLVFSLYVLDDHSHQEIADKLKISVGTSKSNLHRAKVLLKKSLTAQLMTKPA